MQIDFKKITNAIRSQFNEIARSDEKFQDLELYVMDEQAFLNSYELSQSKNAIYIVLQYGEASTSLTSYVLSVTYRVLGLKNEVTLARDFLARYATTYNLKNFDGWDFVVNTPSVASDFNEGGNTYRNLFEMSALIVYGGDKAISFKKITYKDDDGNEVDIPTLSFQDNTTNTPTPQVYGDSKGRTRSYVVSQTYTFTITTYSLDNTLIRKVNKIKYGDNALENDTFVFTLTLSNGDGFKDWKFKLTNATLAHNIGNIDGISLTFTL